MEHPYYQQTLSVPERAHQQQELSLFHPEQPSSSAPHAPHVHNLTSADGFAQLSSFGEHSPPVITSNLESCRPGLPPAVLPNSRKRKRAKDWDEAETSALLECVNLPQFRYQKRNQDYMRWDAIANEIQNAVGSHPAAMTGKRCKERMKTLRGCYEKVRPGEKEIGVTEEKWRKSKGFAVDWWYTAVGEFCGPRKGRLVDRAPATKTYATRFNSLNKLQMSTLLDLHFFERSIEFWDYDSLLKICEGLSIVQKRSCLPIYEDIIALKKMGLLREESDDGEGEESDGDEEITSESSLDMSGLVVQKKFFEKAVDRNPAYDTRRLIEDKGMVKFDATRAPRGITMLSLDHCDELEVVDLSGFRELRFLSFWKCPKLREVSAFECLEELGWLEIVRCRSYQGYPPLQKLPSLQAFCFNGNSYDSLERVLPGGELDVSGCVGLRTLEIRAHSALSSIRGLEELRSLTCLEFLGCKALRSLPDIGHMKRLTRLTICDTLVEEIKGVEMLSSLKDLYCWGSKLKALPDLSHLPHLKFAHVSGCPMVDDPSSFYYRQSLKEFAHESEHVTLVRVSEIS